MLNHVVSEAWQVPVPHSQQPDNASQATPLNLTGSQPSQTFQRSPARFHSLPQPTQSHHSSLFVASQPNNILHTGPLVPQRRLLAPRRRLVMPQAPRPQLGPAHGELPHQGHGFIHPQSTVSGLPQAPHVQQQTASQQAALPHVQQHILQAPAAKRLMLQGSQSQPDPCTQQTYFTQSQALPGHFAQSQGLRQQGNQLQQQQRPLAFQSQPQELPSAPLPERSKSNHTGNRAGTAATAAALLERWSQRAAVEAASGEALKKLDELSTTCSTLQATLQQLQGHSEGHSQGLDAVRQTCAQILGLLDRWLQNTPVLPPVAQGDQHDSGQREELRMVQEACRPASLLERLLKVSQARHTPLTSTAAEPPQASNGPLPPAEKAPDHSPQPLPVQKTIAGPADKQARSPRGRGARVQQPVRRRSRNDAAENAGGRLSPDRHRAAFGNGKASCDTLSSNRPPPQRDLLPSTAAVVTKPAAGAGAIHPQKRKSCRPQGKGNLEQVAHPTSAAGEWRQTLRQVPNRLEDASATKAKQAHRLRTAHTVDDGVKATAAAIGKAADLEHMRAAKKQRSSSGPAEIGSGSSSGVAAFQTLAKVAAGRADEEVGENIDEMDIRRQIAMRMGKHRAKRRMAAKKKREECGKAMTSSPVRNDLHYVLI